MGSEPQSQAERQRPLSPGGGASVVLNWIITLLIFLSPSLDGGVLSMTMLAGAFSYWLGAALVGLRRGGALTCSDRCYLAFGQVACVGVFLGGFWVYSR